MTYLLLFIIILLIIKIISLATSRQNLLAQIAALKKAHDVPEGEYCNSRTQLRRAEERWTRDERIRYRDDPDKLERRLRAIRAMFAQLGVTEVEPEKELGGQCKNNLERI